MENRNNKLKALLKAKTSIQWLPIKHFNSHCRREVRDKSVENRDNKLKALLKAKTSIQWFPIKHINSHCRREVRDKSVENRDNKLKALTVLSQFLEVSELEDFNQVWNRILWGLLTGQLSFILRAGTGRDTRITTVGYRKVCKCWSLVNTMWFGPSCWTFLKLSKDVHATVTRSLNNCRPCRSTKQSVFVWSSPGALLSSHGYAVFPVQVLDIGKIRKNLVFNIACASLSGMITILLSLPASLLIFLVWCHLGSCMYTESFLFICYPNLFQDWYIDFSFLCWGRTCGDYSCTRAETVGS